MRKVLFGFTRMKRLSQSAREDAISAFFAFIKCYDLQANERRILVPELLNIAETKALSKKNYAEAGHLLYALACVIEVSSTPKRLALIYHEHVAQRVLAFLSHPCVNVVSEAMHVLQSLTFLNSRIMEHLNRETNIAEFLVQFINSNPSFQYIFKDSEETLSSSSLRHSSSSSSSSSSSMQQKFQALPTLPLEPKFYPPFSSPFPETHPHHCRWPSEVIESPVYFVNNPHM
ncbi:uncharacterized protein MONOS_15604p1 [Monocercomonoides exilis]|uniref:uncharacterized protein n=1 Tax=Monocercomonoides exilis TaxID=2049356 RepID=UPI00355A21A3|nr:hypothetical protein MONOS_15604p1 [Monocercomonoides exilis]